jgi:transposase
MLQRAFRRRYVIDPPMAKNIRRWYEQFQETGCLCNGRSPGRSRTSEKKVHRVQETFKRSPRKFDRRASRELTVRHVELEHILNSL